MTTPLTIAILDDFQHVARGLADWDRLGPGATVTVFTDNVRGAALVQRLQPFDVVVVIRERTAFPRSLVEQLPNLRLLVSTGMRNRGIDLAACRDRAIPVLGTAGSSQATAELTWGLILGLARNIVAEDRSLRAGMWQTDRLGTELAGCTLGVVGLGRLGTRVAQIGLVFGMTVIAWSPNLTDARAAEAGVRRVEKAALFREADVVTLHLIMSERSRGTVGAAELVLMHPGATVVNTSRAGLIDGPALVAALSEHRIAGAGLDVFDEEPLPASAPILTAPNTILTPHLGYATRKAYESYFPQVLECIEGWRAGTLIRPLQED